MKIALVTVASLFLIFILSKLPILKTQVNGNDFYYKDVLGFIYTRHSSCGLFGPCLSWDKPLIGVRSNNFTVLKYTGIECLDAYAKSNTAVYFMGKRQPQISDPATFKIVDNRYATDAQNTYKLCYLDIVNK